MDANNGTTPAMTPPNISDRFKHWMDTTPAITRIVIMYYCIEGIISLFLSPLFVKYLSFVPDKILGFHFYLFLTPIFIENGLLMSLCTALLSNLILPKIEHEIGSIKLFFMILKLYILLISSFFIILYTFAFFPLFKFSILLNAKYFGFLPILLSIITINSMKSPNEKSKFCCIPQELPNKYIPLLYCLLLMFGSAAFSSYIFGLLAGYIYLLKWFNFFDYTDVQLSNFEAYTTFSWLVNSPCFISINNINSYLPTQQPQNELNYNSNNQSNTSSEFSPFSGPINPRSDSNSAPISNELPLFGGTGHKLSSNSAPRNLEEARRAAIDKLDRK